MYRNTKSDATVWRATPAIYLHTDVTQIETTANLQSTPTNNARFAAFYPVAYPSPSPHPNRCQCSLCMSPQRRVASVSLIVYRKRRRHVVM